MMDHSPAAHDRQISRQAAFAAKMAEHGEVVSHQSQKYLAAKVLAIFGIEPNRPRLGRMIDHMNHEAHEPIDEVFPSTGLSGQTSGQQIAVNFGERHGVDSPSTRCKPGGRSVPDCYSPL